MELIKKEVYITGTEKDPVISGFVDEIRTVRASHQFVPDPSRTALLIMDMQNFFFDQDSHAFIPSAVHIKKNIFQIRKRCRELEIPVIYTRHLNSVEDAGQMGRWWRDILTRDNRMSEIIEELIEPGISIVEKSQYNAFYQSGLEWR